MIIRLETSSGVYRVDAEPQDTLHSLIVSKIGDIPYKAFLNDKPIQTQNTIDKLQNGVLIKVEHEVVITKHEKKQEDKPKATAKKCNHEKTAMCLDCLPPSPVTLERSKVYCNHPKNAMCSNCVPLAQWDFDFHSKAGIKYLSFESYKLFLKDSTQSLVQIDYEKKKCTHGPNEKCMHCMKKALPIIVPIYRMIDHIEIGCRESIERMVVRYKATGRESFGLLIGTESEYKEIPGGVKVEVKAVFIPEQESYPDGFVLQPKVFENLFGNKSEDSCINALHQILKSYELKIVGCVYTSLNTEPNDTFLSAPEIKFVSYLQSLNKYFDVSSKCFFNSRFVTLVLSKCNKDIELKEFMISEQGMALLDHNLITLTEDSNLFLGNDCTFTYKKTNEYSIAVRNEDNILPADYLLVRLTHGYKPNAIFNTNPFEWSWKNKKASKYFGGDYSLNNFNNLDVLIWLKINGKIENIFDSFLHAVLHKDSNEFEQVCKSDEFQYFLRELRGDEMEWVCEHCTFMNHNSEGTCEMCSLPR